MTREPELIIATDLDGTFLHPDGFQSNCALYSLIESNQDSIKLIYVTGRSYESVIPLLEDNSIPSPEYIIADIGSTILKKNGDNYIPIMGIQQPIADKWPGRKKVIKAVQHLQEVVLQEVPQERRCSFYLTKKKLLPTIQQIAQEMDLDVLISAGKYLDFLPQGVSKGHTLERLITEEFLQTEKILTAGDSLNDLSLFTTPYKSVVVENAEPALKQAVLKLDDSEARIYFAEQVGPDGILEAISHFGLFPAPISPSINYGKAELIIAYHRQPFEEVRRGDKYIRQRPLSPNGIIPSLLGLFQGNKKGAWIAWSQIADCDTNNFEQDVVVDHNLYPNLVVSRLALTEEDVRIFYKQFSKEALWPIIFSFPERAAFIEPHWLHFYEINRLFAEKTAMSAAEGAIVWIHDYNLWMMPGYLRDLRPDLKIMFFHHTAFPAADIFNIIPWRGKIIASLLKCDYIGFHIPRYVENFVDVVGSNIPAQIVQRESCAPTFLTYGCALAGC